MSQDITFVSVKKIKAAKSLKKGLANTILDQIYDSVTKEGLFNPIVVRPDPDSPGNYLIVQGEHRFYVVARMCKDEVIACRIFADMSAEEAELATLTENACRTNAKPTDRLLILRKWQEVYRKYFPHLEGRKASGNSRWANSTKAEAKQKAIDDEKAKDEAEAAAEFSNAQNEQYMPSGDGDQATVEVEIASETTGKHKTLRDRVKAVTGMSDATITRELKINEGLDEEQVYALNIVQCTKQDMLRIIESTPGDKVKRGEIVALVCSGMEIDRATKEVLGVSTAKEAVVQAKAATESKKAEPESDEAWFLRECATLGGALGETDQYKSDAILFHRISEARNKFRKSIKKIVEEYREERKGKKAGWFFLSLYRVLNISHPNDWKVCGTCKGTSMVDPGDECPACRGSCYQLATEKYT